jgi:2',3'-cyclic-nucleotide 2'-phosphodiesterase / 3'-nucleotidase / 5'-nucleotidase
MKLLFTRRRRLVTLAVCCLTVPAAAVHAQDRIAATAPTERQLVVLATTDVHGHLRGWDYFDSRPDSAHSLAAAATIVDSIRAARPGNVILVDAGDLLQGNPLTTVAARTRGAAPPPHPVMAAMNAMHYDAASIGNHEFNYGLPFLRSTLRQAHFPFLSANASLPNNRDAFPGFTLVRRGDLTVGIVGATTPGVMVWDRDHVRGKLRYTDIIPALRRAAERARSAGAEIVVAVVHAGLDGPASYDTVATALPSENVAHRVPAEVPGVDLVVYGHSHSEMVDTMVSGVRLMQPRNWAGSVGVATLNLTKVTGHWHVTSSTGASISVRGHAENQAVLLASARAHAGALAFVGESLAVTHQRWSASTARAVDAPIADLVGEVMRRASGAQLAASPVFSLDAHLDSGTITVAAIAKLYPYENTLRVVRITGAQLRAFLEHSARYWKTWRSGEVGSLVAGNVPGFNFDLVVGASYEIDLSQPIGSRIRELAVDGRPVTDSESFTIALSNYRQTGGGGFTMLAGAPVEKEMSGDIRDMVIAAVRAAGTLDQRDWSAVNWRIVPAAAESAAIASFSRRTTSAARTSAAMPRLRVIGLNDFHGAFEARPDNKGTSLGGAGALTAMIRRAQSECAPPMCYAVLVDAGDEFQGTPASNLTFGRAVVTLFDSIGVTAAALGNHEFDYGQDSLRARFRQASYATLAANIRDTLGNVPSWVRQDTVVQRGPFSVGIIGISTVETPKTTRAINVSDLRFLDPAPIVSERAAALRAAGANVIVLTGHVGGFCNEANVCEGEIFDVVNRLTTPVDVVISGHTHSFLNQRVRGVPVVQARSRGQAIDVVDVVPGDTTERRSGDITASRVLTAEVRPVFADSIVADPQGARIAGAAVAAVTSVIEEPVGRILAPMPRDGDQYAAGNLIADAMREAAHSDIAVMNTGGIRAGLQAGDVKFGALYEVQPFSNTLFTLTVRGAELRRYLARLVAGPKVRVHVSGVELRYDAARPADDRLTDVRINGRALDPKRIYTITINDFMVTGGDGLGLADVAMETRATNIVDLQALVAYVRARPQGVAPTPTDRIQSVTVQP